MPLIADSVAFLLLMMPLIANSAAFILLLPQHIADAAAFLLLFAVHLLRASSTPGGRAGRSSRPAGSKVWNLLEPEYHEPERDPPKPYIFVVLALYGSHLLLS